MRDHMTIESELDTARNDLALAIADLRDRFDIRTRIKDALDKRTARTRRILDLAGQLARTYPVVLAAILGSAMLATFVWWRRHQ